INALLQKSAGKQVNFNDVSKKLSEVINGNTLILSRRGRLLGVAIHQEIENDRMKSLLENRRFLEEYTSSLLSIHESTANIDTESVNSVLPYENRDLFRDGLTTIVPISGGGERLGTLILGRLVDSFNDDELILAEYGATVVGMEILQGKAEEIEMEA